MQPKNSARYASMSLKTLGLALASSCLFYSGADAAGLGKITVLSALGQPLRAEIELTAVSSDDAGNVVPKLASPEAYKQANVGYNNSLASLTFSIQERGSRHYVLVTSPQSVNEPFLEILVELNSSSGKLVREYTILLDPVDMQASNAPLSSSTGTTVSTQANVTTTPLATTQQQPAAPVASRPATAAPAASNNNNAAPSENGATYQIKNGDTLGKIANQYKPQGVSLEQMLVALQRTNSAAFIDNNMNLLRSGRILTIPDAAEIERTNQAEAKKIVLAQSNDFNTYRNKFAAQVEQAKPEKAVEPKKTDSGKITAKVTEAPTPVNEAKDKLKLSKAQQQELADKKALEEDKIAKQRALDAANARVKELEANTAKLQTILDLKNKAAASAKNAPAAAPVPATVPAVVATAPVATPASMPVADTSAVASKPVVKPRPKVVAAPASAPEPGIVDNLMKYLPYGAAVLAILGLLGLMASKRKKKASHFDDESLLTGSSIKTNSLFGSTGGQSVDTNNSVFNSNFAPSASQLDANEVDPVAEADVYIAYGRDEQAEEILKEALRTQPDRQAVRVKLLEIYAHRKDTRTFETVASELYGMTGGEGADWAQAASLGIIIDPQNPLYAGGQATDHSAVLGASTLPVESLDPEALLGNSLSQEMLDSISVKGNSSHSMMMGDVNERTHRTGEIEEGLDFDLGLSTSPEPDEFSSTFAGAPLKVQPGTAEIPMHDLSNEIQIPGQHNFESAIDTPPASISAAGAKPVIAEESGGMDFAALDFDFDIPKSHAEKVDPVAPSSQNDDIPMHDRTHVESTSPSAGGSLDYDLSSIDLDLPKSNGASASGALPGISGGNELNFSAPAMADLHSEENEEVSEIEFSAEMATKLDLAVAYQEIGDKDGARELLEEVLKGGNQEQIARAKTMMHELA
jgi:pilus assembly protein FimV